MNKENYEFPENYKDFLRQNEIIGTGAVTREIVEKMLERYFVEKPKFDEKTLIGKIKFAEYGNSVTDPGYFGLRIGFEGIGWHITTGTEFMIKISNVAFSEVDGPKLVDIQTDISVLLDTAEVNYIHELVGLPVKITTIDDKFLNFRILKEVL